MFGCLYLFYDNVNLSIPTVNMRNRNVQQIFFFANYGIGINVEYKSAL